MFMVDLMALMNFFICNANAKQVKSAGYETVT